MNKILISFQQDVIFSIPDLFKFLWKIKYRIFVFGVLFYILGALIAFSTYVPSYESSTLVIDNGLKENNSVPEINLGSLALGGGGPSFQDPSPILKSSNVLGKTIRELGLQSKVWQENNIFSRKYHQVKKALKIYRSNKRKEIFLPPLEPFQSIWLKEVFFEGEYPLKLRLIFTSDVEFELQILNQEFQQKKLCNLHLNKLVHIPGLVSFRLEKDRTNPNLKGKKFYVVLDPLEHTIKKYGQAIEISFSSSSKLKSPAYHVSFKYPDRYFAASFLNRLCDNYFAFYEEDSHAKINKQLEYLHKRSDVAIEKMNQLMHEQQTHYTQILNDPYAFLNFEKEVDFLAKQQADFQKRLFDANFHLNLLDQNLAQKEWQVLQLNSERYSDLVSRIQELKNQRDSLDLLIHEADEKKSYWTVEIYQDSMSHLENLQKELQAAENLINQLPARNFNQLEIPPILQEHVKYWQTEFASSVAQAKEKLDPSFWVSFEDFLHKFHRISKIREKILRERLAYKQDPVLQEFEGIDLETADRFLIDYSKDLDQIAYDIQIQKHLLNELNDEKFQLSSFPHIKEIFPEDILDSLHNLTLQYYDSDNYSEREQERIQKEIELKKHFVRSYLKQDLFLLQEHYNLTKNKLLSLQKARFDLIQKQISVYEEELQDFVNIKKSEYIAKKELLFQQMKDLHQAMQHLPNKWLMEQKIKMQMTMNHKLLDSITNLIESKNIGHNLEILDSRQINKAYPAFAPITFNPFLKANLYSLGGVLVFIIWELRRFFSQSLSASSMNLKLTQHHVLHPLSKLSNRLQFDHLPEKEIEKLRQYLEIDTISTASCKTFLLLLNHTFDYSKFLGQLINKTEAKALIIHLDKQYSHKNGLIHFLEKEIASPTIYNKIHYDEIYAEKATPYLVELLHSKTFSSWLEKQKTIYNYLIFTYEGTITKKQTQSLTKIADSILVNLHGNESFKDLKHYRLISVDSKTQKIAFLV